MITKMVAGIWVRMVSTGMLVICVDQKGVQQLKHVCVTKKKSKCVIICTPLPFYPPNLHFHCFSKENKLFWSRKRSLLFYPYKIRLGTFCILVFPPKKNTIKKKSHTFLYAFFRTRSFLLLYSSYRKESIKFQWED